jgi:hypothetical protein
MEVMAVCGGTSVGLVCSLSLMWSWLMGVCFGFADLDLREEVEEFLEST